MAKNEQKMAAALAVLSDSKTLTEAADKAGISRKTLYNYIREERSFARVYRNMMEEAATAAAESMAAKAEAASSVIEGIMMDEQQPAMVRLKAAQMVLEEYGERLEKVQGLTNTVINDIAMKPSWA